MRRLMSIFAMCGALALVTVACATAKDTGFPPVATASPSATASAVACGAPETPVQLPVSGIQVCDNGYTPKLADVSVGTSVTWTWTGSAPHSVSFDNGAYDSAPGCSADPAKCQTSGTATFTVNLKAGKYHYYCRIHGAKGLDSGMYGYLIVTGSGGSAPPAGGATASPAASSTTSAAGSPAAGATKDVAATDAIKFDPADVTINTGDTVQWTAGANVPHTATSLPGAPDSFDVNLPPGKSGTFTFTKPGKYDYYCKIHGKAMSGTITVK